MVRVRVPSIGAPKRRKLRGAEAESAVPRKPTAPEGLVLSATGGEAFFWTGMQIVHVPRVRHDTEGYYRKIGVPPDADEASVRAAAKRRLMEAHPDHGGSEEEFMEAYAAYQTLTDPARRAEYDTRPPVTAFSVEVELVPVQEEIGPLAPSHGARTAYYKEPDIIMSDDDEREVESWARCVFEAAQARRKEMSVKVGIRKRVQNKYAIEPGNVYTIEVGAKAKRYMAHVLMQLSEATEATGRENLK